MGARSQVVVPLATASVVAHSGSATAPAKRSLEGPVAGQVAPCWADAGSFDSLLLAARWLVAVLRRVGWRKRDAT